MWRALEGMERKAAGEEEEVVHGVGLTWNEPTVGRWATAIYTWCLYTVGFFLMGCVVVALGVVMLWILVHMEIGFQMLERWIGIRR